jgi:hypothetical protein
MAEIVERAAGISGDLPAYPEIQTAFDKIDYPILT